MTTSHVLGLSLERRGLDPRDPVLGLEGGVCEVYSTQHLALS